MESDTRPIDAEYKERLRSHRLAAERTARRYQLLSRQRRFAVIAIVFAIILTEKEVTRAAKALVLAPAALAVVLIVRRNRAARAYQRSTRAADYYDARLAALAGDWAGRGESGTRYLRENHPSALDLELFGVGSLFELLCTARTRLGQDTLASWLSSPANASEVRSRQAAVAELQPRIGLQEDLIVLAAEVPDAGRLSYLAHGSSGATRPTRGLRRAVWLAPVLSLIALGTWHFFGVPFALVLAAFLPQLLVALQLQRYAHAVLEPAFRIRAVLRPLAILFVRLEKERFTSARMRQMVEALNVDGRSQAQALRGLDRILSLEFLALVLAGRPQLALIVDAWFQRRWPALRRCLQAVAEVEALGSLACRARENPHAPFPEIVEEGARFEAEGLGHPFLPAERCVANDLALGGELRLLMVSGSNMSGKSTFLRTVGVNAVLALAGAPVRAKRLRLSPLVVGATLRIEDSLRQGRSRFLAEALRVRQLLDLAAGPIPLLFLLDELFQGTNSRDRRAGAEAILRRLLDRGAIGLVTTHDLALTEIADQIAPRAGNVHFVDQVRDGALAFDYRLRPGVVPASNALALLRTLGIEV